MQNCAVAAIKKPGTEGLLKKSPASRIIPLYIDTGIISSMEVL